MRVLPTERLKGETGPARGRESTNHALLPGAFTPEAIISTMSGSTSAQKEGKKAQGSDAPLTHSIQHNGSYPEHLQFSMSKTKPLSFPPNQIPFQTSQFLSAVISQSHCLKP